MKKIQFNPERVRREVKINEFPTAENVDYNRLYLYNDLTKFGLFEFNRQIDETRVKKYKKLYLANDKAMLNSVIDVDLNTMCILNGQHRTEGAKQAQEEGWNGYLIVRYVKDVPTDVNELKEYIIRTQQGRSWNLSDFISSSISDDSNDLQKLTNFAITHKYLFKEKKSGKDKGKRSAKMRLAAAVCSGKPVYYKKALKDGSFKLSKEEWEEAEITYNEICNIVAALKMDTLTDIPCFEGVSIAWNEIRNDRILSRKIEELPNGLNDVYSVIASDDFDKRHTTSAKEWVARFKYAILFAYNKKDGNTPWLKEAKGVAA